MRMAANSDKMWRHLTKGVEVQIAPFSGRSRPRYIFRGQRHRPDKFAANYSGVQRLPSRFVTAFVTWRYKSSRCPEPRRNEGLGIEPAFQFRSALGDGSWKNQGGMEGLFEA
jgi:hypothetical protein